jgi:hypothetical protein
MAAERELRRLVTEQETKPTPVPEDTPEWGVGTTVNQAIAAWKANGWADLSPSTASDYETVWKLHIEKSIGRRRIASLTPFDVEKYLRGLKNSGLSQERVRRIRAILHRACRLARRWSGNARLRQAGDRYGSTPGGGLCAALVRPGWRSPDHADRQVGRHRS